MDTGSAAITQQSKLLHDNHNEISVLTIRLYRGANRPRQSAFTPSGLFRWATRCRAEPHILTYRLSHFHNPVSWPPCGHSERSEETFDWFHKSMEPICEWLATIIARTFPRTSHVATLKKTSPSRIYQSTIIRYARRYNFGLADLVLVRVAGIDASLKTFWIKIYWPWVLAEQSEP